MTVLDQIIDSTEQAVAQRREQLPLEQLEAQLHSRGADRPFAEALARPGLSVIAEFKRRSPSAGEIRPGATVAEVVDAYQRGGAAALSILTEAAHFGGSLDDLVAARSSSELPILRKDFIVDYYQLVESAVVGADAILLIAAALEIPQLQALYNDAIGLDLDVLVEVHDEQQLTSVLDAVDPDLIGINNRDLRNFSVDVGVTHSLLADIPAGKTVVSESGLYEREQLAELERVGVDAVLVGQSLLACDDPGEALEQLTGGHDADLD